VNTAGEAQKSGMSARDVKPLIARIVGSKHLRIKGLMTMAPLTSDEGIIRKTFSDLRTVRDDVAKEFSGHPRLEMKYLSMGMTDDYKIALEEGANMLRLGRAVFD